MSFQKLQPCQHKAPLHTCSTVACSSALPPPSICDNAALSAWLLPCKHEQHCCWLLIDGPATVSNAFHLLQGVGNFVNVSVLCILMPIFGIATPNHPKNKYKNTYGAPR